MTEIAALAEKAARGAGAPPAQAAHFAKALICHLNAGRQEADLIEALEESRLGSILTLALDASGETDLAQSYRDTRLGACAPARLTPSHGLMNTLHACARKTYVPATDASRLSGAGAGLTDND